MKTRPTVVLLVDHVPAWLVANFNATMAHVNMVIVELNESATSVSDRSIHFTKITLPRLGTNAGSKASQIDRALSGIAPDVVLTFGWNGARNLAALSWALRSGVPAIVATDSKEDDFSRSPFKEAIKRRLLSCYSAAWAAGTRSTAYLKSLGMDKARLVAGPVDTIDIFHFEAGAEAIRRDAGASRKVRNLPDRYFLTVSRLSPEKNLPRLVQAYSKYRSNAGVDAWRLVIVGEGPSRPDIERAIAQSGVADAVTLVGWVGFDDMPAYYGLAGAFVLASSKDTWGCVVNEAAAAGLPILVSTHAGSAPDLVSEGLNGFTFDPLDCEKMTRCLWKLAHGGYDLTAMGAESKRIIARWSPEHYAASLVAVAQVALDMPKIHVPWIDRAIVSQLASAQLRLGAVR